tara:strand:- start:1891 stop:2304 length:414 start_codon:yes stop_codon:yes gene_type:complete
MTSSSINTNFIKALFTAESGAVMNELPVGNWWFNKSLFHQQLDKKNFSFFGRNLTEGLWSLERGISDFKIIPNINGCDYKASTIIYYKIVDKSNKFWKDKDKQTISNIIKNSFYIPMEYFNEFCIIIAESYNEVYFS